MNTAKKRRILVTSALPYANGSLHLGHLVGYIQTDIWVRWQKLNDQECYYICADDAHGTPIMIKDRQLNIEPTELIAQMKQEHELDFADFHLEFDQYHTTHSEENRVLSEFIFEQLNKKGNIEQQEINQAYDPVEQMFLPDRFVKGICPHCKSPDQYGDSCEVCGSTYSPNELIEPRSVLSGAAPIEKASVHYFFRLDRYAQFLNEWTQGGQLQAQVANKLMEWFQDGLKPWDISRDAPYFGFRIPGTTDKYFYVWLDAPVGYMSSFKYYCDHKNKNIQFADFWDKESDTELYHFIGKDIIYFHSLFWPAMLEGSGFRLPTAIFANGFLTINGQKMSKSRGTFITARDYLNFLQPEFLRYYFAAKLNSEINDIDLNFEDFEKRTNADLIGKVVNIASRCAKIIQTEFKQQLSEQIHDYVLQNEFVAKAKQIAQCYEGREYHRAMREIMSLADRANQYLDQHKPWNLIKDPSTHSLAQAVCTQGLNCFRLLMLYLKPVLPATVAKAENFLNIAPMRWVDHQNVLLKHEINIYEPLLTRIDVKQINSLKETLQQQSINSSQISTPQVRGTVMSDPIKPNINIDDFDKIDLRIAKILTAEHVEGAEKLLKLTVDIGTENPRQIFAGIKSAHQPEQLIGKNVVVVANLEPRKMRFGTSEAMIIVASGAEVEGLFLVEPQDGAQPGMRVK